MFQLSTNQTRAYLIRKVLSFLISTNQNRASMVMENSTNLMIEGYLQLDCCVKSDFSFRFWNSGLKVVSNRKQYLI